MGKAVGEAGPGIDLQQQIGDLNPWQPIIRRPSQILDNRRRDCFQRRNHKAAFVQSHLRQFPLPRQVRYLHQRGIQRGATLGQESVGRAVDRQGQRTTGAHRHESGFRQEIAVEGAELAAFRHPDVTGAQALAQMGQNA